MTHDVHPIAPPRRPTLFGPLIRSVSWLSDAWHGLGLSRPVALALQPFSYWPDRPSALLEQASPEALPVPGYAFNTGYTLATGRRISFRIRLPGLTARSGQLILSINPLDEHGELVAPLTKTLSLPAIASRGGKAEFAIRAIPGYSYALIGVISDDAVAHADGVEIDLIGGATSQLFSNRFEQARRGFLSAPGIGEVESIVVQRHPTLVEPISQMCTAGQMDDPLYRQWCDRLEWTAGPHRKQWEYIFICRALEHYGALHEGARGLGFGVGNEPITSICAAAGCSVVATDMPAEDDRATIWNASDQFGANLRSIHRPELCDAQTFFERVSYRSVDMTAIPADLTGFDFTWSSCAYEHLGSIEAGLAFFEASLACLKPGGLAVHTTELNLSSNVDTLDNGPTVIFRRKDIEELAVRLIRQGHEVIPITFDSGESDLDRVIDMPPYSHDPHLRLALLQWVTTSFGMIVRKKH
jgi:hypothetical protein